MRQTDHLRTPPGPKLSLSRQQIIDAALKIVRGDGTGGLTLRRLGSELGVAPMTLYSYFSSKRSLEDALVAHVMPEPPDPVDPDVPWHENVRSFLIALHDAFADHRGTAELFVARSTGSRAMDGAREFILSQLAAGGLSDQAIARMSGVFDRYLAGSVMVASQNRTPTAEAATQRLAALPEDEFPVLRSLAREYPTSSGAEQMPLGLDLIISGLRDLTDAAQLEGRSQPWVCRVNCTGLMEAPVCPRFYRV